MSFQSALTTESTAATTASSASESVAPTSYVEEKPGRAIFNFAEEYKDYLGVGGIAAIVVIVFLLLFIFIGYRIHRTEKNKQSECSFHN